MEGGDKPSQKVRHSRKAYQQGSPTGEMLRYDTVYHIQKKLLSPPIPIPIEGAIRQILLSLTNTRKQNKLKRSQGKGNWAGFRSRRIKREKLELVSVNEEWQAAPGVMSCTRQAVGQGLEDMGPSQENEAGPLTGAQMR